MIFKQGSELDKQIYKEGEPSWGLKRGFLDVEDVESAIKQIIDKFNGMEIVSGAVIQFEINSIVGSKLSHYSFPKLNEGDKDES